MCVYEHVLSMNAWMAKMLLMLYFWQHPFTLMKRVSIKSVLSICMIPHRILNYVAPVSDNINVSLITMSLLLV
mgnify:FL=1